VATNVSADVKLDPLQGDPRTLLEQTQLFHLVAVVVDPFTYESSWILPTAVRILRTFAEADCRVGFVATCSDSEARQFLGPYADEFLTFTDPRRDLVKALELEALPALIHINVNQELEGRAEGWHPAEWRSVAENLAHVMSWHRPTIPQLDDPKPFDGSPAAG
jgi:hypothetical protein